MYDRTVLNNGLPVLTSTMPQTRSVTLAVFVGAGSRYETDEMAGLSHFLEHLPFKGTRDWPTAKHVSEAIEGVGGMMNASTDREMTVYWVKVARDHFPRAVSVLSDMILHPTLDPVEVEKEREVILEELRASNDQPGFRADLLIDEALWPDQAMGRDVGGSIDSVRALEREEIYDYMCRQYVPGNTVVAAAGELTHEEVLSYLEPAFGSWKPGEPGSWLPLQAKEDQPNVRLERRKTDQAYICVGLPGVSLDHPDRYAMNLLNSILGGGMSSRLFQELREKESLAYDVHSSASFYRDTGCMVVSCGTEPPKGHRAVTAIMEQLGLMRERVSEDEMERSRELFKGRLLLRMEDTRSVAMWLGAQELLQGEVRTVDQVVDQLSEVTAEDVQRLANEIIATECLNLSVVGPYRSERPFQKLLKL
jgi:predicted Zn-dependent peptidase